MGVPTQDDDDDAKKDAKKEVLLQLLLSRSPEECVSLESPEACFCRGHTGTSSLCGNQPLSQDPRSIVASQGSLPRVEEMHSASGSSSTL